MVFTVLMVVFTIIAYVRLIRLLLQEEDSGVRPNIASWFTWLAVDVSLLAASMYAGAVREGIIFGIFAFGSFSVISLLFQKGEIKLSVLDQASLVVSFTALVAWIATNDPKIAVYLNVVVLTVASIPTLIQTIFQPELEDNRVWGYFFLGGLTNLLAVESWDMLHVFPAFTVLATQFVFFGFSSIGRLNKGLSW